jgi:hypothetical protein
MSRPRDLRPDSADPTTTTAPPGTRRPLKNWLILLAVWTIGLAIWALYLGVVVMIVVRFF